MLIVPNKDIISVRLVIHHLTELVCMIIQLRKVRICLFNFIHHLHASLALKPCFWDSIEIHLLFSGKQQEILPYVVDNTIFGISVPGYPSKTVEILMNRTIVVV